MGAVVSHLGSNESHSHERHPAPSERLVCLFLQASEETWHAEPPAAELADEETVVETASLALE